MRLRSTFMVLTVATLTALSVAPVPATAAQASSAMDPMECYGWPTGNNGEGAGRMKGTYNLKNGPLSVCGNVARLTTGTLVYYHCYIMNVYEKYWYWVRVSGTNTYGWMSNDNLNPDFAAGNDQTPNDNTWTLLHC